MIIIIRALSHVRKIKKEAKVADKKRERNREIWKEAKEPKQKREKKREGTMLLCFSTLVLHNSTMFFMIESLSFRQHHILVGIFII